MTPETPRRDPRALEIWLIRLNQWTVIALMAVMTVLVIANVFSRYLLSYSIVWVEELTRYLMVWVTFLGSGLVLRYGAHVAVDTLQDALPPAIARVLRVLIVALLALTLAYLTWLGARYVAFAWDQETPILNWNTGLVLLAIPIGSALMLVHLLLVAGPYVRAREFDKSEVFSSEEAVL